VNSCLIRWSQRVPSSGHGDANGAINGVVCEEVAMSRLPEEVTAPIQGTPLAEELRAGSAAEAFHIDHIRHRRADRGCTDGEPEWPHVTDAKEDTTRP